MFCIFVINEHYIKKNWLTTYIFVVNEICFKKIVNNVHFVVNEDVKLTNDTIKLCVTKILFYVLKKKTN